MSASSHAGPGKGTSDPTTIHEEREFGAVYIGWDGNGYTEDTCWIVIDEAYLENLEDNE